jgi:hypothetical protein
MTGLPFFEPDNSISMPAATGVGLKARRMSTSLPDDFNVDTVELNKEFTSTSLLPGKRGKMVERVLQQPPLMVKKVVLLTKPMLSRSSKERAERRRS